MLNEDQEGLERLGRDFVPRPDAKVPAAKRIFTALCHCTRAQQLPRQRILETDLAVLPGMGFRGF